MGTHVIAAVDYSPATDAVVDAAGALAGAFGGGLPVVQVAAGQLVGEHAELRERAEAIAGRGVDAKPLLVMGDTVEELLDLGRRTDAAAIVAGSHGRSGLHHLLLGSISEALVRHADRPVLVVPVRAD